MRRRTFFTLIAGVAAWPLSVNAQQPKRPLIGFLSNPSRKTLTEVLLLPAFHRGLAEARYVEGENVAIEYRFADGQVDRIPALAADLVKRNIDVLVTFTNPTALAAKAATTTIPIVFIIGGDPVKLGLVDSLNRPAGNVTGITFFSTAGGEAVRIAARIGPTRHTDRRSDQPEPTRRASARGRGHNSGARSRLKSSCCARQR
jgi:putative tryptophan/tyrosine transport system substrate-binding protein